MIMHLINDGWSHLETFPKHFHEGSEVDEAGKDSYISKDPLKAMKEFLIFVESKFAKESP